MLVSDSVGTSGTNELIVLIHDQVSGVNEILNDLRRVFVLLRTLLHLSELLTKGFDLGIGLC